MRKIDWDKALSEEDIAWLRQAGIPGTAERIAMNVEQFKVKVPEVETPEDTLTRSALDPEARRADLVPGFDQTGAPQLVDPTRPVDDAPDEEEEADDYDSWSKPELENEVEARNSLEGTSDVTVVGTGSNGSVVKADLIKGLRLWDQENPGALEG